MVQMDVAYGEVGCELHLGENPVPNQDYELMQLIVVRWHQGTGDETILTKICCAELPQHTFEQTDGHVLPFPAVHAFLFPVVLFRVVLFHVVRYNDFKKLIIFEINEIGILNILPFTLLPFFPLLFTLCFFGTLNFFLPLLLSPELFLTQ